MKSAERELNYSDVEKSMPRRTPSRESVESVESPTVGPNRTLRIPELSLLREKMYNLRIDKDRIYETPVGMHDGRTLKTSNFNSLYANAREPSDEQEFLSASKQLVHCIARRNGIDNKNVLDFWLRLEKQALGARSKEQKIDRGSVIDYAIAAEYMWTSTLLLEGL